jgi:colanic acid/amylovoran biosynthesis glycosyltransferase
MLDNKVIHLVTPYLFHTGSWVYSQIKGLSTFEHYVFTQRSENLEQFPLENIYAANDLLSVKKLINKVYRRLTDRYGLFYEAYMNKISPALLHAHMGYEAARWLKFVKKTNIPLITTFYGQDVSQLGRIEKWRRRYQELFEYGTKFLAEGSYLKKQLVDLGCPAEKVIVQHLGVSVESYTPKEIDHNSVKRTILQVSTFREKKGIEYSLEAIAMIRESRPDVIFKLIGRGDNEEADNKIKSLVKKLHLEKNVELLGAQPYKKTLEEMSKCDIFLHPSVTASNGDNEGGAPVGLIEASALGLPVVATLHADIPEVIINNKSGFLVEERNSEALAAKLLELLSNSAKMKEFGQKGREHVMSNYNLLVQINKLTGIYENIINGK